MTAFQWQVVGLTLLVVSGVIYIKKLYQSRDGTEKPGDSRPVSVPNPQLHAEPASVAPISGDMGVEDRIFLDLSPSDLFEQFSGMTDYQAETINKIYLGKWLEISGYVLNVEKNIMYKGSDIISVICSYYAPGESLSYDGMSMSFNADQWEHHLAHIASGDRITVCGKISNIKKQHIYLENCEKIS